jgi:uncharacterized membrane protein
MKNINTIILVQTCAAMCLLPVRYLLAPQGSNGYATLVSFSLLSSFGLFLGRVNRWNSWDAFTHPLALFHHSLDLLLNPTTALIAFLGFFFLLQGLGYALLYHLSILNSTSITQNSNS